MSGWMFLLVPAHPDRPGRRAVKRSCVCWYVDRIQLLTSIVCRRPRCLSLEERTSTVICLHKLLVNCKLPDVAVWLLRCLLALTQLHVNDSVHTDAGLSTDQWTDIYTDCLRYRLVLCFCLYLSLWTVDNSDFSIVTCCIRHSQVKCILVAPICVCLCLSLAACIHYCTYPDIT